jgi:AraC-like DNA-binding protein
MTESSNGSFGTSGPPLLRLAHVMAFMAFLHRLGAPVGGYLRRSGLPTMCEDPNAYVPVPRIWSFFDTAARNEDSELGWRVVEHAGDHQLYAGLLRKFENAPSLLQALRRFVRLARTEATGLEIGLEGRRDRVLLYSRYSSLTGEPGCDISEAYRLGIFLHLVRHFLGPQWVPDEVGLESAHVSSGAQECFPGSRFLTQQPAGYIAVPRSCLHRSLLVSDTKVGRAENPLLNDISPLLSEDPNYLSLLHVVLKAYIPEGYVSQRHAAELMNTSVRTLTRRLSAHHLTYGELIDGIRFNAAKKLLRNPDMKIGDVAHSVGFEDQGDFTRMFRRVGGLCPKEFRNSAVRYSA